MDYVTGQIFDLADKLEQVEGKLAHIQNSGNHETRLFAVQTFMGNHANLNSRKDELVVVDMVSSLSISITGDGLSDYPTLVCFFLIWYGADVAALFVQHTD